MKISYIDDKGVHQVGDYWSGGPLVRNFKEVTWVISPSRLPVLVGKRYRTKKTRTVVEEFYQIAELQPGQHLNVTDGGEVYVS